ncbi:MAG TPA: phage major capsid protein [Pirellulales bacterium]|nr:phage major capsid protein [Pirellulales bacterium]
MNHQELLTAVQGRRHSLGIGLAADYLRELQVCLGGGCPSRLLEGVTPKQWRTWMTAAKQKLVYHHPEMTPIATRDGKDSGASLHSAPATGRVGGAEAHGSDVRLESLTYKLPPHTIATFPAVITTTRQDRDGDVLETSGAQLDPAAPLLWQHLPDLPIGRLLSEDQRTSDRLTGTFAIAGTAMGQDAALLAEHGALRISHGFLPTAWEPLDVDDPSAGYHILQFQILEVSLVSVPSNPDAVIEAFSRQKLAHPLVKAWAGARFEARPVVVGWRDEWARGRQGEGAMRRRGDTERGRNGDRQTLQPTRELNAMDETAMETKAGRVFSAANEKRLRAAAFHYQAIEHHDDATDDVAELARKATQPLDDMLNQPDSEPEFAGHESGEGDVPAGEAACEVLQGKAGRAVSAENAARLNESVAHGKAIVGHAEATAPVRGLANEAVQHVQRVLATDTAPQDDDDGDMSYDGGNPEAGVVPEHSAFRTPNSALDPPGHRQASAPATSSTHFSHLSQEQGISTMPTETQVTPETIFSAPVPAPAGAPRVKRASEQYDSTKRRLCWPTDKKASLHLGRLAGQDLTFENRPAYTSSQLEKAMAGAWLKHKLASQLGTAHLLSDHDKDLYRELVERGEWVGEVRDGNGTHYYREPNKLAPLHQKTLLADSTSGGQYAVPYFFDVDLVTFPLLYGELFPLVDLRELNTSNQVKGATLANLTISAGPAEGDTPGITLQTTTNLVGSLTTNIYNATGAITIGRDFLADSPIDLQADIIALYQKALLQWLDKEIATGDGTTGPLGLFNTSNVLTASGKNSTAGPMTVSDVETMVKTLPKQYRNKQDNVVWVGSDALYFRIRGISVSGTDQRRIFGYDYEQYMLASHPYKVENDVAGSSLAFVNMSKYRMWRRKGMEIQVSDEGKTLMLANELLIVARSRWGGQLVDPGAMVEMTNAALH